MSGYTLENGNEEEKDIGVLDIKRSPIAVYEREGYIKQLLTYALSIKQTNNISPKNAYLILIKRPFDNLFESNQSNLYDEDYLNYGQYNDQLLHIRKVKLHQKESPLLKKYHVGIVKDYIMQEGDVVHFRFNV